MRLSILVPVYNVSEYLPVLLEKLSSNLPLDTEVVFYNDASTDHSLALLEDFQQTHPEICIRILCGLENVGLTRVRGKLINASNAEYVWFIDADDIVESSFFNKILAILEQDKPDVLLFNYDVFFDDTGRIKHQDTLSFYPKNQLVNTSARQIYRTAILDGKHYFWNKIFRRELIQERVDYSIAAFEDIAYTPVLLNQCQSFYYLAETIIHYRIRNNSIAQKMSVKQTYGIRAYLEQARYATEVVHDRKSQAYLLYKVFIYYYRLMKKIPKANISHKERYDLIKLANQFFDSKGISVAQMINLLIRENMYDKAIKILVLTIYFRIHNY